MLSGAPHCSHLPEVRNSASSLPQLGLFVFNSLSLSRFGSFEIFKSPDEYTGRRGPSCGLDAIRGQMIDYVIEMFYPEIQQNFPDRTERNVAFFREVRTQVTLMDTDMGLFESQEQRDPLITY